MNQNRYFLAIDIGASSGRHILGYIKDKKLQLEEIYRFKNGVYNNNNQLCWNLDSLFKEILNGLKKCKEMNKIPSTLAIDTWGVDFVLLDNNDKILGDTVSYRDNRTANIPEEIFKFISKEEIYKRTGIQNLVFNTINQLYSIKKTSNLFEKANTFLMIPDYFNFLLTGKKVNEYTNASTTQLLNLETSYWDFELLEKLGIPKNIFQPIVEAGTSLGFLKDDIVKEIGFDLEVITAPSHDTASAVLAVPSIEDNFLYLSSGTWSLLGTESINYNSSLESLKANFTNEGGYSKNYRYLKNIMGLWIMQNIKKELEDKYTFPELSEMAKNFQGKKYLIDVNDNNFLAPNSMIEAIKNYCQNKFNYNPESIEEVVSIVYNSLAKSYTQTIQEIEKLTSQKFSSLYIIGGGCQDNYLNYLAAQESGLEVFAGPIEATAIGNLGCQMLNKKYFNSIKEFRNFIFNSFDIKKF
ncbi:MAG: rhamnulokinase [Fusobacterium mortiferum]|nr:rhamnulokinase [Fusobacterium mortiferum]MDY2801119.1 rhamnulokinase [Fusobacterium mortiferum]MDY4801660.1 rhamnulokinase [Fusobacterium mortiferum]